MEKKFFIKVITSLPVILIFMYFIPFIGIALMILRTILKDNFNKITDEIIMICIGVLLMIPKLIIVGSEFLKINIDKLNSYISFDIYIFNLYKYGSRLIIFGVIYLIILILCKKILNIIGISMNSYIREQQNANYKIAKENDMKMREKQERAKNTKIIKCPYCGASNIIQANIGVCKYCRKEIK